MRTAQVIAWIFVGLQALVVLLMFTEKNAVGDITGQDLSRVFVILLFLVSAGLLLWSQLGSSRLFQWTAVVVASIPVVIALTLVGDNYVEQWRHGTDEAQKGRFADAHLTEIARAIDRQDSAAEKALLEQRRVDWEARDRVNATLLGHAVKRILFDYPGDPSIDRVHILLAHGAPLTDSALGPDRHLLETVFEGNMPAAVELLKLFLDYGADPNALDSTGLPLIQTISCTLEKLKVLEAHGANLNAPNNRADRPKWTPLMNAAYYGNWDQALYLLEKGVPPDYKAPDGSTLETVLAYRVANDKSNGKAMEPGYFSLLEALKKRSP
jgi:hypothetical protein